MPTTKQRGSSVIYVASSARELPAEVQDWLGRAENRAGASPHIYDLLAQLAQGKKFTAIIVNIQSVDWNEMDFFEQAARLSRGTPIYVAGPYSQRAKIEAACRRGARLFDALALTEVYTAGSEAALSEEAGLVSQIATPQAAPFEPKPNAFSNGLKLRVTSEEKLDIAGEDEGHCYDMPPTFAPSRIEPAASVEMPVSMPVELSDDVMAESPVVGEEIGLSSAVQTEIDAEADRETEASALGNSVPEPIAESHELDSPLPEIQPEIQPEPRSSFRLAPVEEEPEPRIMFPWSAYPDRPRRIPPRTVEPIAPSSVRDTGIGSQSGSVASLNVRLTPEEIAALMGKPPRSDQAREAP